jgi:hypothetical protein
MDGPKTNYLQKKSHMCTPMYRSHEVRIKKWKSGKSFL